MSWTHRTTVLVLLLLAGTVAAGPHAAAEPAGRPAGPDLAGAVSSLKEAIRALEKQCGAAYPAARLRAAVETAAAAQDATAIEALTRQALVTENPLLTRAPLLFVVRRQYSKSHHNTHNFSPRDPTEFCDAPLQPGAALKTIDLRRGKVTTLLEAPEGVIRDPRVHWDGTRIVFSMKKNREADFHIYEINADGTGLRQLTHLAHADHFHPLYLPTDDIVFTATREPKYCQCNRHIMANLYRMEPDGANIHQITRNNLFDRPNDITPDGRILYDRWEYVDRNFGDAQGLWTVNPDGTNQAIYWGNNTPQPMGVIDARILPGAQQALAIFTSLHDLGFGALAILDRRYGMDGRAPVRRIWPANAMALVRDPGPTLGDWDRFSQITPKYQDPYPLSEQFFLVSRLIQGTGQNQDGRNRMGLYLVDVFGHELALHAEEPGAYAPMPLAARPRPPVIPDRRTFDATPGRMYVHDVYAGQTMQAVPRGSIRALRVVEAPEKRSWSPDPFWHGQGGQWPAVNWQSHETKRILGTVPVEADGSAYFEVPAGPFIYFQLLDQDGMMVQSMRSGTVAQPGETTGCIGCHEDRRMAPSPIKKIAAPLALRRPPSRLEGWRGSREPFNFMTEVQPIFDAHCVSCHDFGKPAGKKVNLARDRNLIFNTSYNELWRKQTIHVTGGGSAATPPAYGWGSHASPLVRVLQNKHSLHEPVKISPEEFARVVTWIDLNGVFYPDYATAFPGHPGGRAPLNAPQIRRLGQLAGVNLNDQFHHQHNKGPLVSFDRPEVSPLLSAFKDPNDPAYLEALALIRQGARNLAERPDAGMEGFQLSGRDRWRNDRYEQRARIEQQFREAIRTGKKLYDRDLRVEEPGEAK